MAKIYAIRESGMSPKDIPTKGYNNENINPAKKMSCAGGPGREGSSPREIKNNTSEFHQKLQSRCILITKSIKFFPSLSD